MKYIDLNLPTPQENLACDEALLDFCQAGGDSEILRFWEPAAPFVVLGCSSRAQSEVNFDACRQAEIPILRRPSGGGTVLQGPGCLNFSLILRIPASGPLTNIRSTNAYVITRHVEAMKPLLGPRVQALGLSDIALGSLKFSGNAQRRKRDWLLFHGTFLRDLDIELIERVLGMPCHQPDYRNGRSHKDFLTNAGIPAAVLQSALRAAWSATEEFTEIPFGEIARLCQARYASDAWNFRF